MVPKTVQRKHETDSPIPIHPATKISFTERIIIFLVSLPVDVYLRLYILTLYTYKKKIDPCLLMSWRSLETINCNMHSGWHRVVRVRVQA